jgi:hypothetical protein
VPMIEGGRPERTAIATVPNRKAICASGQRADGKLNP